MFTCKRCTRTYKTERTFSKHIINCCDEMTKSVSSVKSTETVSMLSDSERAAKYKKMCISLTQNVKDIETKLDNVTSEYNVKQNTFQSHIHSLEIMLDEANANLNVYKNKETVSDSRNEYVMQEMKENLSVKNTEITNLTTKLERVTETNNQLSQQLTNLKLEIDGLTITYNSDLLNTKSKYETLLHDQKTQYDNKINMLESDCARLKLNMDNTIEQLKTDLTTINMTEKENLLQKYAADMQNLLIEKRKETEYAQTEIRDDMRKKLEHISTLEQHIENMLKDHSLTISKLQSEHDSKLTQLNTKFVVFNNEKQTEIENTKCTYENKIKDIINSHTNILNSERMHSHELENKYDLLYKTHTDLLLTIQNKTDDYKNKYDTCLVECEKLKKLKEESDTKLGEIMNIHNYYKTEYDNAINRIETYKQESSVYTSRNKHLESELNKCKEDSTSFQSKLEQKVEFTDQLTEKINQLQLDISKKSSEYTTLQSMNNSLMETNNTLQSNMQTISMTNRKHIDEIKTTYENDITVLNQKLEDNSKSYSMQLSRKDIDMQNVVEKHNEIVSRYSSLESEREKYVDRIEKLEIASKSKDRLVEQTVATLRQQQDEYDKMVKLIDELRNDIEYRNKDIAKYRSEIQMLQLQEKQLLHRIDEQKHDYQDTMLSLKANLDNQSVNMIRVMEEKSEKIKTLETTILMLNTEKDNLMEQIHKLNLRDQTHEVEHKKEIDDYVRLFDEYKRKLDECNIKYTTLTHTLKAVENSYKDKFEENIQLKSKTDEMNKLFGRQESRIIEIDNAMKRIKIEQLDTVRRNKILEKELEEKSRLYKQEQEKVVTVTLELEKYGHERKTHNDAINSLNIKITETYDERNDYKEKYETCIKDVGKKDQIIVTNGENITKLKNELRDVTMKLNDMMKLNDEHELVKAENFRISNTITEMEKEKRTLEIEIEKRYMKLYSKYDDYDTIKSTYDQLRSEIDKIKDEKAVAMVAAEYMRTQMSIYQRESEGLLRALEEEKKVTEKLVGDAKEESRDEIVKIRADAIRKISQYKNTLAVMRDNIQKNK